MEPVREAPKVCIKKVLVSGKARPARSQSYDRLVVSSGRWGVTARSLCQSAARHYKQVRPHKIMEAQKLVLERVLGSEAGFVAAKDSKNGLKSTFCPQDTPVEREALSQTAHRNLVGVRYFEPACAGGRLGQYPTKLR